MIKVNKGRVEMDGTSDELIKECICMLNALESAEINAKKLCKNYSEGKYDEVFEVDRGFLMRF